MNSQLELEFSDKPWNEYNSFEKEDYFDIKNDVHLIWDSPKKIENKNNLSDKSSDNNMESREYAMLGKNWESSNTLERDTYLDSLITSFPPKEVPSVTICNKKHENTSFSQMTKEEQDAYLDRLLNNPFYDAE